jgi:hypothetical protein
MGIAHPVTTCAAIQSVIAQAADEDVIAPIAKQAVIARTAQYILNFADLMIAHRTQWRAKRQIHRYRLGCFGQVIIDHPINPSATMEFLGIAAACTQRVSISTAIK